MEKESIEEYQKRYREENKEKIKETRKKYRETNKEKVKERNRLYHQENKDRVKTYRKNNKEKTSKYNKTYREKHKGEKKEYFNEYYKKNMIKIKDCAKKHRENNIEKVKERSKQYYQNNKEKSKTYQKENMERRRLNRRNRHKVRIQTDPLYKLSHNVKGLIRQSIMRNKFSKNSSTIKILGCSFEEFKYHIESHFELWMNWDNYALYNGEEKYGWDIDHIIPSSSAKCEEDVYKLNHYSNLQPLCSKVNRDIKKNFY